MKQTRGHLVPYLISAAVLCFAALFLLSPDRAFSENENRYLQQVPAFSLKSLKDGSFTDRLVAYAADQFPLRDSFMTVKTEAELFTGRQEVNGIFVTEDGALIEEYRRPQNTERVIRQFGKFITKTRELLAEENRALSISVMLVPTAEEILAEKLPQNAPGASQTETIRQIREGLEKTADDAGIPRPFFVPAEQALREAAGEPGRQLYYRTDHHWTTEGAYFGYRAFCETAGLTPAPEETFTRERVTEEFRGTVWSKLNDSRFPGEAMELWRAEGDPALKVLYTDTGEERDTLYNLDYLQEKDKYSLFLDNLHSLIEITSPEAETERCLMILKDSYANCMVPFLTRHFRKICVFDTRSYKKGPSAFVKDHPEITDVLILYNMNTLDGDTGIGGIY